MLAYSDEFGQKVREVMDEAGLTPGAVERASVREISHTTVAKMRQGQPPNSDHVIVFARAVGAAQGWSERRVARLADDLLQMAESSARYRVDGRTTVKKGQTGTVSKVDGFGAFRDQTSVCQVAA